MNELRFAYPHLLWLLALLPLLALWRGKSGPAPSLIFSTTSIARVISGGKKARPGKIPVILRMLALALLIGALARPQFGNTTTEVEASGIDILLAVDVSGSMEAQDFTLNGQPANRLDVVKSVDHIIDLGPEGGEKGGLIIATGTPEAIATHKMSYTGKWLKKIL